MWTIIYVLLFRCQLMPRIACLAAAYPDRVAVVSPIPAYSKRSSPAVVAAIWSLGISWLATVTFELGKLGILLSFLFLFCSKYLWGNLSMQTRNLRGLFLLILSYLIKYCIIFIIIIVNIYNMLLRH